MSSAAGMMAETATVSLDTAKVRLMVQKVVPGQPPMYTSLSQTLKLMVRQEGPRALLYGLSPGI